MAVLISELQRAFISGKNSKTLLCGFKEHGPSSPATEVVC